MVRTSAAVAAQTAQDILDSATQLFASRGFFDVSLGDIANDAGVTRGAIYHHYQNKVGLFLAVAARLQTGVAKAVVSTAEETGPDPQEQLKAGSHAFLDAITAGPAVRILLVDGPSVVGWDKWRQLDAQSSVVHLRDALERIGLDHDLVDALTAQLSGAMNEAALWIAQHDNTEQARIQAHAALDRLLFAVLS